jgi:alpha-L-arabinofuranosidase
MKKEFHVAVNGSDLAEGTQASPFRTISKAAKVAETGDKVIVHEGEYREWVMPEHSGYSNISRITYEAAEGEKVVIKGSERIQSWVPYTGTVWKVILPNTFFGEYNPYKEILSGDWFMYTPGISRHPGEVYLNGVSFYEADSLDDVKNPVVRTAVHGLRWFKTDELILHPELTVYQWFCETNEESTTIYANFQGADPNIELVEINVRKCCFYPVKSGLNYITVRGFEMAQAACPWTPPTADQPGLLGVNWSKGWIIENNIIHDAKCSGISIGKEASTGHNLCSRRHQKPGYQYQMEAVFRALQIGWSKEKIGSHVIRNNVIYDCGQNGIVGHMGGVFSEIYNNHIYNIAVKHEFFGYEIAGIKLHAAIDVQIHHNRIHNTTLGTWLDWQAQGVRVTNNLYYNNDCDLMVEVSHGPYLVDNNIFASDFTFENAAQGGAYVNNLCCGKMNLLKVLDRSTPYHFPHTTEVAGTAVVYGGDDRFTNNLFIGDAGIQTCGTAGYNPNTASYVEYVEKVLSQGVGDLEMFKRVEQPAYISTNAYFNGAEGFDREKDRYTDKDFDPHVKIVEESGAVFLEINIKPELLDVPAKIASTETLGTVRIVDAIFDDPHANPIVLDRDYLGAHRSEKPVVGPIEGLKPGFNRIQVWG